MLRLSIAACAVGTLAFAGAFRFTIGGPVASQDFQTKSAAFVFRTDGCVEPAKPQIDATAEGLVKGTRQTVALKVMPSSKPNVYAVFQTWPTDGAWVVKLNGTCAAESASAIVPVGPKGFIRESSKFFPRPATNKEVDASLKAFAKGGGK